MASVTWSSVRWWLPQIGLLLICILCCIVTVVYKVLTVTAWLVIFGWLFFLFFSGVGVQRYYQQLRKNELLERTRQRSEFNTFRSIVQGSRIAHNLQVEAMEAAKAEAAPRSDTEEPSRQFTPPVYSPRSDTEIG